MSLATQLDTLRAELSGCSLVAFGDLGAKLTLRASSARSRPQDQLDDLCAQAAGSLESKQARLMSEKISGRTSVLQEAIVLTATEARVFLRSRDDSDDVLCCVFGGAADAYRGLETARQAFDRISGGR